MMMKKKLIFSNFLKRRNNKNLLLQRNKSKTLKNFQKIQRNLRSLNLSPKSKKKMRAHLRKRGIEKETKIRRNPQSEKILLVRN